MQRLRRLRRLPLRAEAGYDTTRDGPPVEQPEGEGLLARPAVAVSGCMQGAQGPTGAGGRREWERHYLLLYNVIEKRPSMDLIGGFP